jgi:hypothetical protein
MFIGKLKICAAPIASTAFVLGRNFIVAAVIPA